MNRFSEKIYIEMIPPTEEDPRSDQRRLTQALAAEGFPGAIMPLKVLRTLHEICLQSAYRITATLVYSNDAWIITAIEPMDTRAHHYGLAVDYGSTTIVMQLVDMNSGSIIAQISDANGQRIYGTDILTRITHTLEDPARRDDLHLATVQTFNGLLDQLSDETGVDARSCPAMIISGNTTMINFLLKLDPWTVFASPYAPVTTDAGWFRGDELEMDYPGMVYIMPAISNYIGGDITSGLLNLDFYRRDGLSLFFDIGTNGELVMGNRDWLLAGAGAAGPALEGYISRYGTRAQPGAIDTVSIRDGSVHYTTIDHQPPIGICGSGIIDLIAQMLLNGWINIAGELNPDASDRIVYLADEGEYAAVYAPASETGSGEDLYFSQTDIHQYLETKAAAHTMVDCLLESAGCSEADIDHFHLSGAFSAHSNLESAIAVGIFPDIPREKYSCIPNASLDGARTLLLDRSRMADIRYLMEHVYCVQFASIPDFTIRMYAAKFIPHTDMDRYPTVAQKIAELNVSKNTEKGI